MNDVLIAIAVMGGINLLILILAWTTLDSRINDLERKLTLLQKG